jgi:hypothetical protein
MGFVHKGLDQLEICIEEMIRGGKDITTVFPRIGETLADRRPSLF